MGGIIGNVSLPLEPSLEKEIFHDPHEHISIHIFNIYLLFVVSLLYVILYILKGLFVLIFSFMFEDILTGKEGWYFTYATKYCAGSI